MQVHVVGPDERRAIRDLVCDIEHQDDRKREIQPEEIPYQLARTHGLVAQRRARGPELRDQHEDVEGEANPGPDDAGLRAEGELVERVALHAPAFAEPDVCEADAAPGADG